LIFKRIFFAKKLVKLYLFIKTNLFRLIYIPFAQKRTIIFHNNFGDLIHIVKASSVERTYVTKIYNFTPNGSIDYFYPEISVRKYTNTKIFGDSDFIILNEGAIWTKYFMYQWAKLIPLDQSLLKVKNGILYFKNRKIKYVLDHCISLCGVHCDVWAHFLLQYLPKIYEVKNILSKIDQCITIILPVYKDEHVRYIVYDYLSKIDNIKIIEIDKDDAIFCKNFYFLDNSSFLADNGTYSNPSDVIIPLITMEKLRINLVEKYISQFGFNQKKPFRKIFIGRKGNRSMLNNDEIEVYFKKENYEIIYPHLLSFEQKVKIFYESSIIVGPGSSGFLNLIFCQPHTKLLLFTNYQRISDNGLSSLATYFKLNLLTVIGKDNDNSIHSSYSIPLKTIKSALKDLQLNVKSHV
jgi:hypothetical protein